MRVFRASDKDKAGQSRKETIMNRVEFLKGEAGMAVILAGTSMEKLKNGK